MDTNDLKAFLITYESKSINQAAKKLFISSQGLTKIIDRIETELKAPVFKRTTQGITPTIYGDRLYYKSNEFLSLFDQISSISTHEISTAQKTLNVISTYGVLSLLSINFVRDFYAKYPYIKLNIVEYPDNALHRLFQEQYAEIGFMIGPIEPQKFHSSYLMSNKYCAVMNWNHFLASKNRIDYYDLKEIPLAICGQEYDIYRNHVDRFIRNGVVPNIQLQTSDNDLLVQFAEQNVGISIMLKEQTVAYQNKKIATIPMVDSNFGRDVFLVTPRDVILSAEAKAFREAIYYWRDYVLKNNLYQSI